MINKKRNVKSFLVVGRAGLDLYAEPIGTPIESAISFSAQLGGSAGNIAIGLARQNCQCALLTGISDDAIGRFTKNHLRNAGVATDLVYEFSNHKNTLAVVDTNGEATQAIIYRKSPADLQIDKNLYNNIELGQFSTIIVTGSALTKNPSRNLTIKLMKAANHLGKEVILDIDYRPDTWSSHVKAIKVFRKVSQVVTAIIGNDIEFDVMAGKSGEGHNLARKLGSGKTTSIIYKMGSRGCVLFHNKKETYFDAYKVQEIKPTGAGDAFLAGFCATFKSYENIEQAILNGAASAAIVVTKVGCSNAMPNKAQLQKFIKLNKKPNIKRG